MSSAHSDPNSQQAHPPGAHAQPTGAPPSAGASANPATPGQAQGGYAPAGAPPPGQQPYSPYPPPGGYAPPGGYYPPPGQYYPPPPGQYPQYPGYYPGQYGVPLPGQYPPPPGQYGQYPPPAGYYPPPPAGAPGALGTPGTPGAPGAPAAGAPGQPAQAGQYAPPASAPPPQAGQYAPPADAPPPGQQQQAYPPPAAGSPYAMPTAVGGYPGAPGAAVPYYPAPPHMAGGYHVADPLVYLGTAIPDPNAPPAAHGVQKVPGYDPAHDYNAIARAIVGDVGDEKQRQSSSASTSASALSSVTSLLSAEAAKAKAASSSKPSSTKSTYLTTTATAGPLKSSKSSTSPSSSTGFLNNRFGAMLTLATSGMKTVLSVLGHLNVFQVDALNDYCIAKSGISLADKLERCTSGNFGTAIRALALGPLWFDVDLARKALVGLGTNETLLIELILGRPGHEIRWLKTGYRVRYGRDLVDEVRSDLSGKTERLFIMALNTQKPNDDLYTQVDHAKVNVDVENLHNASKKKDEIVFCEVLVNRSNAHIAAVITAFNQRYKSLSKVIKKTFSGVMEQSLLYIMHGAKPKRDGRGIWRDAKLLEKSMAGLGTKDNQLIYRLVRTHWDPARMESVKEAYKRRYGKPLENRVKGETSGLYKDLLVELIKVGEKK